MLIKESHADVQCNVGGKETTMSEFPFLVPSCQGAFTTPYTCQAKTDMTTGIFLFHPTISGYPNA
jgi:hypothetical protein